MILDTVGLVGIVKRPTNSPGASRSALSLDNFIVEDNEPGVRPTGYAQRWRFGMYELMDDDIDGHLPELGNKSRMPP